MLKKLFLSASIALLLGGVASAQGQTEVIYLKQHGDWKVECLQDESPEGTFENCLMSTTGDIELTNPNDETQKQKIKALRASVVYLDGNPTLIFSALPGALLIPGLELKIDGNQLEIEGNKVTGLSFERCLPDGCITGLPINDPKVLETLKKSGKLNVSYTHDFLGPEPNNVKIDLSMKGFTNGLDDLAKQSETK
ncbi:invasion associated locus B family protein [Ignatzschineria larvae DSM 13226]|uniref:Invasion associated locus B family protein n=1 Tax=Ignatzschineria larvae DSM 13226 TaxID=1111732 RepID=A0ABZ3C343_9GAMM|nr:invasion associated locus B family protein [Ignatzschineria larvae]